MELLTDAEDCCCATRDGMAVRENVFVICRSGDCHVGHVAFRLPTYDRDRIEFRTALAWLMCTHFKFDTYHSYVEKGKGFYRTIVSAKDKLFQEQKTLSCGCVEYAFRNDVDLLYFLTGIVVSYDKKGPTFESVLL